MENSPGQAKRSPGKAKLKDETAPERQCEMVALDDFSIHTIAPVKTHSGRRRGDPAEYVVVLPPSARMCRHLHNVGYLPTHHKIQTNSATKSAIHQEATSDSEDTSGTHSIGILVCSRQSNVPKPASNVATALSFHPLVRCLPNPLCQRLCRTPIGRNEGHSSREPRHHRFLVRIQKVGPLCWPTASAEGSAPRPCYRSNDLPPAKTLRDCSVATLRGW